MLSNPNVSPSQYASNITPKPVPVTTLFPGAGTPRDSAILAQQDQAMKQTQLAKIGGQRKRGRKGGAPTVVVPNLNVDYPNAGTIGATHVQITQSLMQNQANAQFDGNVRKTGGTRKRRSQRGGTCGLSPPTWGCYSGGKRRKKTHKGKRSRRTRRRRRCRR